MFTGLLQISFLGPAVAFNGKARLRRGKAQHMLNVVWVQYGIATAEVPAHQFHRKPAAQYDSGSLGIAPDGVLGGRSDVPFATRRATHDNEAADLCDEHGTPLQSPSYYRDSTHSHQTEYCD